MPIGMMQAQHILLTTARIGNMKDGSGAMQDEAERDMGQAEIAEGDFCEGALGKHAQQC